MTTKRVMTRTRGAECKNAEGDDTSIVCIAVTQVQVHPAHVYMY
jgi:hypothetical protein